MGIPHSHLRKLGGMRSSWTSLQLRKNKSFWVPSFSCLLYTLHSVTQEDTRILKPALKKWSLHPKCRMPYLTSLVKWVVRCSWWWLGCMLRRHYSEYKELLFMVGTLPDGWHWKQSAILAGLYNRCLTNRAPIGVGLLCLFVKPALETANGCRHRLSRFIENAASYQLHWFPLLYLLPACLVLCFWAEGCRKRCVSGLCELFEVL